MKKLRVPIPKAISSAVLVANKHVCCVCQRLQVQLHHIDENPENNAPENLAVLCLPHHDLASMQIGLSKKLRAEEIVLYKQRWEAKCSIDIEALARDRLRFYATVYKNPPRIRELFFRLSQQQRLAAVRQLEQELSCEETDEGFSWQALPGNNEWTHQLLFSLRGGDLWPRVLERVNGHPHDPDYPMERGGEQGLVAYHGFDLYCQLMVRVLSTLNRPIALENLWALRDPSMIDHFFGSLVSFRERATGRDIVSPKFADKRPVGRIQLRAQRSGRIYRGFMNIQNMYVFSDTAAENLKRSKVCGVGILEEAHAKTVKGKRELHLSLKPLIIGIGGIGQSTAGGWWDFSKGVVGDRSIL